MCNRKNTRLERGVVYESALREFYSTENKWGINYEYSESYGCASTAMIAIEHTIEDAYEQIEKEW